MTNWYFDITCLNKGFLLDLAGLNQHWVNEGQDHVVIALLGEVKGESFDRAHLLPCFPVTSLGLNVRDTLRSLLDAKAALGFTDGPTISTSKGKMLESRDIDDIIHKVLLDLFTSKRFLFPADILDVEAARKHYQCFCTFRRSSDTRALEQKVTSSDIDVVNRWKRVEKANGKVPGMPMQQRYAQFDQLLQPFLRYTQAM